MYKNIAIKLSAFSNKIGQLTNVKATMILVIVGFAVFSNSLFNQFVWDDLDQIINNPAVGYYNDFIANHHGWSFLLPNRPSH
jgi:hypothetical protein